MSSNQRQIFEPFLVKTVPLSRGKKLSSRTTALPIAIFIFRADLLLHGVYLNSKTSFNSYLSLCKNYIKYTSPTFFLNNIFSNIIFSNILFFEKKFVFELFIFDKIWYVEFSNDRTCSSIYNVFW